MRALPLGILAIVGVAVAAPAFADDVRIGIGTHGAGVAVEHRDHDRDHFRDRHVRVRRDVTVGVGHREHCKVVIIHKGGVTKKIRRCR
jgi:hypothetical protein